MADLTFGSSEGADVTHLNHSSCEIAVEGVEIVAVSYDERVGGTIVKEDLV